MRAAMAGGRRLRRGLGGGEFRRRAARIPALHPAAAVAGAGGPGGSGVRRSFENPHLAAGRGGAVDARAAARSVATLCGSAGGQREKVRGGAMNLLQQLEAEQVEKLAGERPVPPFQLGDTVRVSVRVVEGERERVQAFEGVCIARKNAGINSNFTLRKISYGEGVERVFPLYSPRIAAIEVIRRGVVRRAKLYYLRGLTGRRARIAERARSSLRPAAAAEAAPASTNPEA